MIGSALNLFVNNFEDLPGRKIFLQLLLNDEQLSVYNFLRIIVFSLSTYLLKGQAVYINYLFIF